MLRYHPCVTRGSHSFTCHPHTNHTCLYSPATRHHRPLAGTNLYCLVTEAHRCAKLAQSFYAACPAETRTQDLLISSPTLYPQHHDATRKQYFIDVLGGLFQLVQQSEACWVMLSPLPSCCIQCKNQSIKNQRANTCVLFLYVKNASGS